MDSCVFRRILAGELPGSVAFEDDLVVAFLDIVPVNPGHTLVLPRRHVASFTELAAAEAHRVITICQAVAIAQRASLKAQGATISLPDGVAAGQEVPHAHVHVIPRYPQDGFGWRLPAGFGGMATRANLDQIASQSGKRL